ncbi:MAG: SIS domain-containing protein [Ornithinimicrobium sp.]|uniref:SIS domain-containing protein n=1 Tax=Ornithinimicrobium sp. TaxID=1977084 RepID=UPI0026DED361|nr:SIS domain-containing protein [Ornithinimicrobium sp.]MDO5738783.1 SIS domain-containing protein [Ornithinimicrobium sp.]
MLNFDPDRYVRIQQGAVGTAPALAEIVDRELERGLDSVLFLGAGGAGFLMDPAAELLAARSTLPTRRLVGGELVAAGSSLLGPGTLVVVPSLSGTTPDALEHIATAKAAGARVLALVGDADTPVAQASDHVVANRAADDTSSESFYLQSQILAVTLLQRRGEWSAATAYLEGLQGVPEALLSIKEHSETRAEEIARHLAEHSWHIFTGSGPSWTEAHYYAMCILEEMQWIRTRPVHASDFFHGTLELVEPDTSIVLLIGEGPTRAMDERVRDFVSQITDQLVVLDSTDHALPGVDDRHRHLLSHVVHAAMLQRVSAHLEVIRDHPLSTRRYYRRVSY